MMIPQLALGRDEGSRVVSSSRMECASQFEERRDPVSAFGNSSVGEPVRDSPCLERY